MTNSSLEFVTESGATYRLTEITSSEISGYTAGMVRLEGDKPMLNVSTGGNMENTEDTVLVWFSRLPEIGGSFAYIHALWDGCISTPVNKLRLLSEV